MTPNSEDERGLVTKDGVNTELFSTTHVPWGRYAGKYLLFAVAFSLIWWLVLYGVATGGGGSVILVFGVIVQSIVLIGRLYLSVGRMFEHGLRNAAGG
ncbi:hypothetical protein GJ633_08155 [Halorubrum sp. CBA1125]|uniref:hypothetical protein n=1 Tax=Halorubrum sp. CBA1125 TaxID=2668072 RepID=UPI0012E83C78|nr:hypothetical protein [Halorubrum sp. CBA1125]MUW14642.1 hypothetical protein [Halorubrum sp. CBA1125]